MIKVLNSSNENVNKYVFEQPKSILESVLYRYPDYRTRTVMCISTMSGCTMGCSFCGASKAFIKNLSCEEICNQVDRMIDDIDCPTEAIDSWQIMFMSMGEPLHNLDNVLKACEELNKHYPNAKLLISTSAPKVKNGYEKIIQKAKEIPTIGLQFSVHESTDEARKRLINRDRILTLKDIGSYGEKFYRSTGRQPFFNYCVHENNNSNDDLKRLVNNLKPQVWQATLSVICEKDESMAQAVDRQAALATEFSNKMIKAGYSTRVFNPAGQDDIGGGCGQLWQVQKKFKEMGITKN